MAEEIKKPSEAEAIEGEEKEEAKKEEKKEESKVEEPKKAEEKKEEPALVKVPEKKEKEKPVKVPAKFKKLVEEIEKMSVLDLAELVKILEKKFGVSAAPQMVAAAAAPAAEGAAPAAEEKSVFNIVLTAVGEKKIDVIKAVRDVTQKGLKDSKDLVDVAAAEPQTIKENVKKDEAEEIKKKFEAAGAKVELK